MADDNQVFRLSYVFDGERFTGPLNQVTANALRQLSSLENANVRLTNVTVESAQKQASAVTQGSAAVVAATQAQTNAINKIGDATRVFSPATDRVVTFSNRLQTLPTLARNFGDPFVNEVNRTKIAVDSADAQLKKFQGDAQKTAELVVIYSNAVNALAIAQDKLATSKTIGANVLPFTKTSTRDTVDVQESLTEAIEAFKTAQAGALISRAPLPTEPTQVAAATGVLKDISNVNVSINPNNIQDARALAKEVANLTAVENALNQSARNLLDTLDPLSAAQRRYAAEVANAEKLAATFRITTDQQNEAIRQAKFTFEETATSIRKETQSTYDTLTAANTRYQTALMSGRVASAPTFAPPQTASAATLSNQLQTNIVSGQRTDPETIRAAKELADQENRLAFEEERANTSAQKLRDTLDPVSAIQRELSTTLMGYLNLLGRGKLEIEEYTTAQARAKNEAARKTDDVTGQTALNAATQRYREELNPTIPLARALNDEIATINKTSLSTSEKIDSLTIAYTRFKEANTAAQVKMSNASGTTAAQDDYERLSKSADVYKAKLNPLITAQKLYANEIARVNELVSIEALSRKEADAVLGDSEQKEAALTAALRKTNAEQLTTQQIQKQFKPLLQQTAKDFSDFSANVTRSFGLNRVGFLELQAAGINAFQSLAAGISPLRTAETEGAQVIGALIQGTKLTLKEFVSYAAPIAAVTAAFVAFGAAVAGAAARSAQIREINVALSTFHQGTSTTAEDLVKIQREFAKTGESTTVLKTALAELARNPNINISATSNILEVARNVGAAFGTDIAGGLSKLTTALDGGAEGIVKLGHELGVLKDGQGGEILILQKTSGEQVAVKRGYDLIAASLKPYTDSLGPAQSLTRSLTGVWNEFIESLKDSTPVQNALKYIQDLIVKLDNLKDKLAQQRESGTTPSAVDVAHGAFRAIVGLPPLGETAVSNPNDRTSAAYFASRYGGRGDISGVVGGTGGSNIISLSSILPNLTSTPSLAAPTIGSYSTALVTDTSGRTGVSASTSSTDRSVIALGSSLRSAVDTVSRFNTTIATSISSEERMMQTETNSYNSEVKGLDAVAASFDKVKNAADPLATTLASIKAPPQTVGGMEVGGAVGGGSVGGGATISSTGVVTFGNPFFNLLNKLETGGRNISQQIFDSNTVKGTPGEGLFQITRPTAAQFSQGQYSSAFQLDANGQAALVGNIPLGRFGGRTQRGMEAQYGPLDKSKTIAELAELTTGTQKYTAAVKENAAAAGPEAAANEKTLESRQQQDVSLRDQTALFKAVTPFLREFGSSLDADTQSATRFQQVQDATNDKVRAGKAADEERVEVITRATAARDKEITTATLENTTTLDTARALTQGLIPGYQAEAEATARLANLLEPLIDVRQRQNQEIQKTSGTVVRAGQEQIAATTPLLARQEALAIASIKGAQAEHEQALVNAANAQSFDAITRATSAYNTAQQSGTDVDKERTKAALDLAQSQEKLALAQIRTADVASQITEIGHTLQQNRDQSQVLSLQVSLQGKTTEEITKQTTLLQTRQYISEHLNNVSETYKQSIIDSVTAVQNLNIKLAEAQRQQERLNQLFQNIGETISSTLGTAIEDVFNGQKTEAWGTQLKRIIGQVMTQIAQFAFIRPAIGSALEGIGLSQAAQSFGTFSNLTGGGATTVGNNGSISGTVGNLGSNVIGGGSIFGAGGFTNFLNNNLGSKLGFATTGEGLPFSATVSGPAAPGTSGISSGGIFGSTTFGQFLGGAGIGASAGILANSLRGGNTITGSVGSAAGGIGGSLAGAAIGSIFPGIGTAIGTLIGGAVGGSGGGLLGGLFGNNKPSNASSGALVNLGTGVISGAQTSGNAQNDQTVSQITSTVSQFSRSVQELTKGTLTGSLNVQAGTRDGVVASFSGPGGTLQAKAKDAATAVNEIELLIVKSLGGLTDTVKTVLSKVDDPSQIQDAVTFANTYDDLKKASDNAFSSISTDVKTIGPFAQALTALNDTFSKLTNQANQFGLSLDPINAGLAEATKRLRNDFGVALDQALNSTSTTGMGFINELQGVAQGFSSNVQEQQAIGLGGDTGTTTKINQLEQAQAQSVLISLTTDQLKQVVTAFQTTNPEIAAMSQALINAGISADSATNSLTGTATALVSFADGLKAVKDTLAALRTGPLAGLSPQQQVSRAQGDFETQAANVRAAGVATGNQLSQLSTLAQTAVQTAQNVYGNAPQTADIRHLIINELSSILTTVSQTSSASVGINPAISSSGNVAAAQGAAVIAALHAAGVPGYATGTDMAISTTTMSSTTAMPSTTVMPSTTNNTTTNALGNTSVAIPGFAAGVGHESVGGGDRVYQVAVQRPGPLSEAGASSHASHSSSTIINNDANNVTRHLHLHNNLHNNTKSKSTTNTEKVSHNLSDFSSSHVATDSSTNDITNLAKFAGGTTNDITNLAKFAGGTSNITDVTNNSHTMNNNNNDIRKDFTQHINNPANVANNVMSTNDSHTMNNNNTRKDSTQYISSPTNVANNVMSTNNSHTIDNNDIRKGFTQYIGNNNKSMISNSNDNRKTTPPGPIIVGEKGPEWMMAKSGHWSQVGRSGPEVINQPGGAIILPNGMTPHGRSFAKGTIGVEDVAGQAPGIGSLISESQGGGSLLGTVGGAFGISEEVLSSIGDILPIAGPIIGGLLGLATGSNAISSGIGAAASIAGFLIGGPVGGVIGGLVGLLGNLFGPKPSNLASGDLVDLSTGIISGFQSAGDAKADKVVKEISVAISSVATTLQKATSGGISGAVNVQDGRRDGIKTSYSGPLGTIDAKWGDAKTAVGQFSLAIAHNLNGIDPALREQLDAISDPNALIPTIEQFTGTTIDLLTGTVSKKTASASQDAVSQNGPTPQEVPAAQNVSASQDVIQPPAVSTDIAASPSPPSISADIPSNIPGVYVPSVQLPAAQPPAGKSGLWQVFPGFSIPYSTSSSPPTPQNLVSLDDVPGFTLSAASGNAFTPPGKILVGEKGPEWMMLRDTAGTGRVVGNDNVRSFAMGTGVADVGGIESLGINANASARVVDKKGWQLVGRNGPEVIDQPGGATILPFPKTPWERMGRAFASGTAELPEMSWESMGRAFADGTTELPRNTFVPYSAPPAQPSGQNFVAATNKSLLDKLDTLNKEVIALRRVTQGGQQDTSDKLSTANRHLGDVNRKTSPTLAAPRRQKFG